jgi:hypothetical protein
VNNRVSPGRKGKNSPHSTNTMTMTPATIADANSPPSPSQYIGSRNSGPAASITLGEATAARFRVGERR